MSWKDWTSILVRFLLDPLRLIRTNQPREVLSSVLQAVGRCRKIIVQALDTS